MARDPRPIARVFLACLGAPSTCRRGLSSSRPAVPFARPRPCGPPPVFHSRASMCPGLVLTTFHLSP